MKRLLDKKIDKKQLEYIMTSFNTSNFGSEGLVIRNKTNPKIVRKLFFTKYDYEEEIDMPIENILYNKLEKIKRLYQIKDFKNDVKIINTVSCNGDFIGYDMISDKIYYPYITAPLLKEEKIEFLKQIKEKLEYFHSLGIVFGDVKEDNILIDENNKDISFCDLDNIQLDNYKIDTLNYCIKDFVDSNGLVNNEADRYMHNLLLLQELFYKNEHYIHIMKHISRNEQININIFNEEGKSNLQKMKKAKGKYKGGYLIDNIK